jgi:membrane protease YdiL (CAAX protease family)
MTDTPSAGEGGRELATTDEPSRRSIGEMLTVLRDRPSVLVGLVVALLGYSIVSDILEPLLASSEAGFLLAVVPPWIATFVLVGFVLWVERRPLASIGVAWPRWSDLWLGIGGTVAGLLTLLVTIPLMIALGFEQSQGPVQQVPQWAVLLIVLTSIVEEVLFRGYPIERLAEITGSVWAAATVTFVVFVLLHAPAWGVGHLITISGISIVFMVMYVRYRRLGPVMIMHFISNFVLLVVVPRLGSF